MKKCLLFLVILSSGYAHGQGMLENMGPSINTEYYDCYPVMSPDGKTLYFSRNIEDGNHYDIYCSEIDDEGNWQTAKPVSELNNHLKNSAFYISPDGNTLWIRGTYGDKLSEEGVSITHKTKNGWSIPAEVSFEGVPTEKWREHSVTLSSDERVIVASMSYDLWVSFRKDDNTWSKPVILPDNINTETNEYTPFLAADNKTLYFSSGGHGGLGQNDIFKTTRLDDTWLNWSDPENLDAPINSSSWETFFSISALGDWAIVYSLSGGDGDIYRAKLKENLRPKPILLIKGKVFNAKTKGELQASIRFEDVEKGEIIGTATTDPVTNEYKIILTPGIKYGVYAEEKGYFALNEFIDLTNLDAYTEITKDLFLNPIESGQTIRLNNIFFEFGKADLQSASFPELNRVIKFMQEYPGAKVEIGGHTDDVGSNESNIALSQSRANSVMNYLINGGIDKSRVSAKGYGESKPVSDNGTEEGRQQNRRVEFTIQKVE